MTPEQLAEIEARILAATPGPLLVDGYARMDPNREQFCAECGAWCPPWSQERSAHTTECEAGKQEESLSRAVGALFEFCVIDITALLTEVRRLTARVEELEEAARWRAPSERPPASSFLPGSPMTLLEIAVRNDLIKDLRTEGWHKGGGPRPWCTPLGHLDDTEVIGWRPLGPGPKP